MDRIIASKQKDQENHHAKRPGISVTQRTTKAFKDAHKSMRVTRTKSHRPFPVLTPPPPRRVDELRNSN